MILLKLKDTDFVAIPINSMKTSSGKGRAIVDGPRYKKSALVETGVTRIFFHPVSSIQLFNSNPVFKNFPVTRLDKGQTKGSSLFYCFRIVTNDFIIRFFV